MRWSANLRRISGHRCSLTTANPALGPARGSTTQPTTLPQPAVRKFQHWKVCGQTTGSEYSENSHSSAFPLDVVSLGDFTIPHPAPFLQTEFDGFFVAGLVTRGVQ